MCMIDFWKRVRSLLTQDLNQAWLCREIGVSTGTFSNWIARDSEPKASKAQAIAEALGVSVEFLITGKDSYLTEPEKNTTYNVQPKGGLPAMESPDRGIPFYDIDINSLQHIQSSSIPPRYTIFHKPFSNCDLCIPAVGDSMEPKIGHGDIVSLRKITNIKEILWGEIYLIIATSPHRVSTLKLVFPNPEDDNSIILRSLNPAYRGDTIIEKHTIQEIYKVIGSIRQFSF